MELKVIWETQTIQLPLFTSMQNLVVNEYRHSSDSCWGDCEIKGWPKQCEYLDITVQMEQEKYSGIWIPTTDMTIRVLNLENVRL